MSWGMSEASDWDPLPEAQRAAHPGELVAAPETAAAPVTKPRAAPKPREVADPAAAAALRRLEQRLASSKPGTSFIAAVQRREDREQRRRTAAQAPFADDAKVVHSSFSGPEDVPLPVAFADPDAGADVDPREREPWFVDLPVPEQERLRAFWWHERHRHDDVGIQLRRRLGRAVAHGALVFFVLGLLQVMLHGGFAVLPTLTAAGALVAGAAELCGGGRFLYAFAGAAAFVVVLGPLVLLQPLGMISLLLSTYTMGLLGMDGEMRRSGGFGGR